MSSIAWPDAQVRPIARAKLIGGAIGAAAWAETTLPVPFEQAWRFIGDIERSVPAFDENVDRLIVRSRVDDGDRERLRARVTSFHLTLPLSVTLESGFCLMQAPLRSYLVVMACEPGEDAQSSRFLHLEGVPIAPGRLVRRFLQRLVDGDVANMTALARRGFAPGVS
jgi:hypothetical protein